MTTPADLPTGPGGMSASWRDYALHLRNVLEQIGVPMVHCLPGEPDSTRCTGDYADHCVNYLAALQAKAEDALTHLHHGDPVGQQLASDLLDRWRHAFASEGQHD